MTAKVTIIDDNGNPKGAYELAPSRTYENGISTKYVFEFEYNQLNKVPVLDKIRAEIEQMDFDFGDFYDHTSTIREMVLEVIDKYNGRKRGMNDTFKIQRNRKDTKGNQCGT